MSQDKEKELQNSSLKVSETYGAEDDAQDIQSSVSSNEKPNSFGQTKRSLESRHINLIAIGGSIGTGLFITIGSQGLVNAGPLGLLLSYSFWTGVILMLTVSVGEMVCYLPVDSPFLSMAGRVVDPAFECAASVNFWLMQSLYIPFEIVAVNGMVHFWRDDYSPAITLCIQIAIYAAINIFAVRLYGETEFWLSLGKLILCIGLLFFTLITMCGGNPEHDAFGFRYWHAEGGPIAEHITTGSLGRFQGFLAGLFSASFTVVSSEYLSMTAGEAKNPRKNMATAFRTVLYRLVIFFIGGALSVSILIAYNDPTYLELTKDSSNAAASPYVVAMQNLNIKVLPDIVNAVILSSAFSAGNSYTYCSSRALYALSVKGFVPSFFRKCTKNGVPLYCIAVSVAFSFLSLLQLSDSSLSVLNYMVSLCTGSQLLNYFFMGITYLHFYRACKVQGIDRAQFTYTSWFQPYTALVATFFLMLVVGILGYTVFIPGMWSVNEFLYNYVMIFVSLAVYIFWKVSKRTKYIKPEDADLQTGLLEIEEHEYRYYAEMEAEGKTETRWSKAMGWIL
ncbi:hypothetical protein METBIDRAFT_30043 [Metschnikowia bicuspidata var. bicuspidata NRRL YB-4993]|uniref:Amino acid permease/ SLC12A domain-containing protein n=1 Tax=Metschnikowia bicuspidata var. bicuspidata NRRL YB-4993 TaxID=869754 RepID=A0A1A0HHW9_9ASCO|nr:hypothetical protein METBIDRAFT_30043 [Metschnikowia bicuspidata var. bicuspidata NRRL YB-4993]OBA23605.1 hypothetical protein METBIDRAFT_30043 [Metschnikowia bicuspidata var. bicuspidata NRRL YB-4993]